MNLFDKATKNAAKAPAKQKKQTVWACGENQATAEMIHKLVVLQAQKKEIDAKMGVIKTPLLNHAKERFCTSFASNGVIPDTPMKLQNEDGESVTFVAQERPQYNVSDDSVELLTELLGEEGVAELVYNETTFSFNRNVMAVDGVLDVVSKHLASAVEELLEAGTITEDQASDMITAHTKRSIRPGSLQRLAVIAGKSSAAIRNVLEAAGSCFTTYIKT